MPARSLIIVPGFVKKIVLLPVLSLLLSSCSMLRSGDDFDWTGEWKHLEDETFYVLSPNDMIVYESFPAGCIYDAYTIAHVGNDIIEVFSSGGGYEAKHQLSVEDDHLTLTILEERGSSRSFGDGAGNRTTAQSVGSLPFDEESCEPG